MKKNKKIISLLILMLMIVGIFATDKLSVFAEVNQNDFDVNTAWTMSNNIGTKYTVKNGAGAYSTGKSKIGDVGVTAKFVKQADRNDGASYLSDNGTNQASYGAKSNMLYGNPDPESIPALGINTQASDGCGGPLGSWQKYNADGEYEVGSVTFKFDRKVTDPILDLSGLGGYVSRVGSYAYNGQMILVGMGSFNSTNLHLATEGITLEKVASNSNLTADNNIIQVKDRNTYTRAEVDNNGYNWIQFYDAYNRLYQINSPALAPAGTGSVKLKGTFDEVTFKLYHQATPYSKFSREKYGTHPSYFANYAGQDPSHGDGINGMNVINTESVQIGGQTFNGDQNWDLFRASLRLPKPSSIGDKVWLDENANGIQDAGEKGLAGVTVKLLDKEGNPVKDFNGNPVQDQVTDANGNYKFDNLAAGEYVVQVVPSEGQTLTTKGQGTADTDSDVDPATGKTDVITLEANRNIENVDAGIVPAKEYKVDYEFKPSTAEGTPETLPQEVLDQLPKAKEKLADGTAVPSPKEFTPVKDEVNKGTWTFEAWDKETATINGADEHVTGTWVFTKDPVKEYKVDYEFKPSTAEGTPETLPEGVLKQLPEAKGNLADGTAVPSPKEFTPVKDEVNKGTWTFEAWDKETATINGADEHVIGTWVFTKDEEPQPTEYKVTHEFKSGTPGKELPEEVLALLPENQTGKVDGNTVVPTEPNPTQVTTADGTWTFKGYDRPDATIDGKDEHFVGTWEFTPKEDPKPETGSVYVKYVAEDGTVLEGEKEVLVNEKVGTPYTTDQKTFDGYQFVKMDDNSAPANGEVKKGDQHVIYVYKPVAAKEYKVDYEFKPSTAEGTPEALPEGVLKQLPEAKGNLADGTAVPSPKEFTPVKDEVNKGTWTFEAWDKETATINGADEHVIGTWVFTKDEEPQPTEYKVTHEFKSGTPGKELPDEVKALLPANQEGKKDGEKVTPTQPAKTEVPVEGGKWVFKNYDKTDATIDKADEHFVGTWEFIKDEEPQPTEYKVTHEFKSGTADKELPDEVKALLPANQEGKKDGEKVTPTQPAKTEVPVEGGKWVFKNYDKTDATIDKADEHFVGTWVFEEDTTPDPEKEYKVTHEFKSGTPGRDLPDEVKALLPQNQTGKVDGNTVVPTEPNPTQVKTADGTWVFKGYDKKAATIEGQDQEFIGVWEFIPNEDPQPELGSVYVKYVTEDGKELEPESEVLVNAEVGTKYTTEQKTFEGYKFVKMDENSAPANGQVKDGVQHVTYVYKKTQVTPPAEEKGNVYVKYVTEDGKVLEAESAVLVNAEVGTKYTTDKKTFDGYEFVKLEDGSAPANGRVQKGDQHVTYVYRKTKVNPDPKPNTGNVYVEYVTEDGRILSERVVKRNAAVGEYYYTELKDFDGFRFIGMGRNSANPEGKVVEGNLYVTYVYKEIEDHDSSFPFVQNRHHDRGTPVVTIVESPNRVISTKDTTEVKEKQEELNNKELKATDKTTDKVEKSEDLNVEDKKESTNNENNYVENYDEEFVEKDKSINNRNKAPKTQDPGIALYAGLAVASSALLGLLEVKRRKNK